MRAFIWAGLLGIATAVAPTAYSNFANNLVFEPDSTYTEGTPKTLYPRSLQLSDGSIIMTWENYRTEPPLDNFLVYRSTDGGATWSLYSTIEDQVNGWGMRYQPFFYALPQDFAGYKAGSILFAGTSIPKDLSQAYIDLYVSTDNAKTWKFLSHIAYGSGPESTDNGSKAIWEAFLMLYQGQLICYYSDQRDPFHAQKLVHTTTIDLLHWTPILPDVADPKYSNRPGMTTVAHIESTNKYIMTYENCGDADCSAYYKVSSSPLNFGLVQGQPIIGKYGGVPFSSPVTIWAKNPNVTDGSGIIIMNGASSSVLFVNNDSALVGEWVMVDTPQIQAYSRDLRIINDNGKQKLFIGSAGSFGAENNVTCAVMDIPSVPSGPPE